MMVMMMMMVVVMVVMVVMMMMMVMVMMKKKNTMITRTKIVLPSYVCLRKVLSRTQTITQPSDPHVTKLCGVT